MRAAPLVVLALLLAAMPGALADPVEPRIVPSSGSESCETSGDTTVCTAHATTTGFAVASEGQDLIVVTVESDRRTEHWNPGGSVYQRNQTTDTYLRIRGPDGGEQIVPLSRCEERDRVQDQHDYTFEDGCATEVERGGLSASLASNTSDHATPDYWSTDREATTLTVEDAKVMHECTLRHHDQYPFEQHEVCAVSTDVPTVGPLGAHRIPYQECRSLVNPGGSDPAIERTCRTGVFLSSGSGSVFIGLERYEGTRPDGSVDTRNYVVVDGAGIDQRVEVPVAVVTI